MPKVLSESNVTVVLTLEDKRKGYRSPNWTPQKGEMNLRDDADEIKALIKRHVLPHSPCEFDVRTEVSREYVCEFCKYPWTEAGDVYNGCCEKDEAGDPDKKVVA